MDFWGFTLKRSPIFWGSLALYGVFLFISIRLLESASLSRPWVVAVALLPVLPLLGVAAGSIAMYYKLDELERRIMAEGIMFGFAVTAVGSMAYGFLENVHAVPQLTYFAVWPMLATGWIVGTFVAKRRYR